MLRPLAVVALLAVSTAPALAASDAGFYAGIGAGRAHTWLYSRHLSSRFEVTSGAVGVKLYLGYRFNHYLSTEFEYLNLGTFRADTRIQNIRLRVDGLGLSVLGSLPLSEKVSLFGKAGYFAKRLRVDSNFRYVNSGYVSNYTESHVHMVPLLGAGAQYRLSPSLALRAEYQHIGRSGLGQTKGPKTDSSLLTLGLTYDF